MPTQSTSDAVDRFWEWFTRNESLLASAHVSDEMIANLQRHLDEIGGGLDWEIGPAEHAASFFAVSPRGNRDLLAETARIVDKAPKISGWTFLKAKPPRSWKLRFTIETDAGSLDIDGREWEVVIYRFKSGTVDVLLRPPLKPRLSDADAYAAATILVDGELGEDVRLEVVTVIEVVSSWAPKEAQSARRLEPGLLARVLGRRPERG